jgi:plasmid stabilization system protein ParE
MIRLLETAREDLRSGYRFYEQQSVGLGEYFLDCMQADVRSLHLYAGIHGKAEGFHRMLAKRFPFAIYYLIEDDRIDIYAILDCRRDPTWIETRLRDSRDDRGE